jgi:hypothetical protein
MSTASLSGTALTLLQRQFEAALPSMANTISHHFRNWPARLRADAVADTRAAIWAAFLSLARRGRDPLEIGATGIAGRCCLYTKTGRKIGNRNRGRACLDVLDHRARRRLGIQILSLDQDNELASETWREWLAEDHRTRPCDAAAFRLDFGRWMAEELPERKRQMAELLAEGHETGAVARMLGVTPAAVSQSRAWLESSWRAFQGEPAPAQATPGPRPVGRPRKVDGRARRPPAQQAPVPLMEAGA